MGEYFLLQRPPRAVHLRRPLQAGRRLPPDVAAAAPPPGREAYPGRRLLPALAPAGARRQAVRRARRRVAHGAADHRDAGRRRVGLHPDERHLDHRRPDLPRVRPLLSGVRPAINVGISVSRVGGNAQRQGDAKVAGRLASTSPQYRELEAFAQFGSELDAATQRSSRAAQRMVATLNQPQYAPWPVEEQVIVDLGRHQRLPRRRAGVAGAALPRRSCASRCGPRARCSGRSARAATSPTRRWTRSRKAVEEFEQSSSSRRSTALAAAAS